MIELTAHPVPGMIPDYVHRSSHIEGWMSFY